MNTENYSRTRGWRALWAGFVFAAIPILASAAGVLTPVGSARQALQLESHHVRVVINNGFGRTEVEQVFYNPNAERLEALYVAPVPEKGALSELTIWVGERTLRGEVVSKDDAERIYEEEKAAGNDAGKASQDSYQNFEFSVAGVPALDRVRMRYVYYEPLSIDTGVGRYAYRLEEGGTDEAASSFWSVGDEVTQDFVIDVTVKSAWPVAKARTPGFDGVIDQLDEGTLRYRFEGQGGRLDKDFVFYYMLAENLPGRLEMMTYRESDDKPGSFMMVMTPGEDLRPLTSGADYVFVLDLSGSMQGKFHTLVSGVKKALGHLKPEDRFRIVTFSTRASEPTRGWREATLENVQHAMALLDGMTPSGSTNLYEGIDLGLKRLDADRVSSIILVTDGVTNEGVVDPARFYALLHGQDVRLFSFLLGNGSNWPLLRLISDASGGYYRAVSNSDDIIGEIMLAKGKIVYESLHDAKLSIDGVKTFDVSDFKLGKIHRGEQLILFGRYETAGRATARLQVRLSGQERSYETEIDFPAVDGSHPELERLWAMDQVQKIELNRMAGFVSEAESEQAVRDLGIAYQIVTDETSMVALDDAAFARRGLERRNETRVAREADAARMYPESTGTRRVDATRPMYTQPAPSIGGGGGGAVEPWMAGLALAGVFGWFAWQRGKARARVSAVALVALGLIAGGLGVASARADSVEGRPRWVDRESRTGFASGSIDQSIASFWEVSEQAASVSPAKGDGVVTGSSARAHTADTKSVEQSRRRQKSGGHLGINLFNAIPILDIVWGGKRETETDSISGTASH